MYRSLVAATVAVALGGCSVLKTQSPQPFPKDPDCRESRGPIVIDFVGAAIGAPVAAVLMYAIVDEENIDDGTGDIMISLTGMAWLLGGVGSGVLGMIRTSRCRDAYEKHRAMLPNGAPAEMSPGVQPGMLAEPAAGTERGMCRPDASCDAGLTCASNRCVVLPMPAR